MSQTYLRFSNALRKRLKYWRKVKGLSQVQLAEMLGMLPQQYNNLEGGKRDPLDTDTINPELRTLFKIALALEVDILELLPSIFDDVEDRRLRELPKSQT
ncbi:MAG: helix-turn-helix domain-containing protein [Deinococcota bacterium]